MVLGVSLRQCVRREYNYYHSVKLTTQRQAITALLHPRVLVEQTHPLCEAGKETLELYIGRSFLLVTAAHPLITRMSRFAPSLHRSCALLRPM
jgi:hypothetical protein